MQNQILKNWAQAFFENNLTPQGEGLRKKKLLPDKKKHFKKKPGWTSLPAKHLLKKRLNIFGCSFPRHDGRKRPDPGPEPRGGPRPPHRPCRQGRCSSACRRGLPLGHRGASDGEGKSGYTQRSQASATRPQHGTLMSCSAKPAPKICLIFFGENIIKTVPNTCTPVRL